MNVSAQKVIGLLAALPKSAAWRGMAGALLLRATITILNFVLISLAARMLGKADFGTYSVMFSAAGLFSVVATFGQQIVAVRSWNEYTSAGQQHLLKGALIFSGVICLVGSGIVALPFYGFLVVTHDAVLAGSVTFYLVALS